MPACFFFLVFYVTYITLKSDLWRTLPRRNLNGWMSSYCCCVHYIPAWSAMKRSSNRLRLSKNRSEKLNDRWRSSWLSWISDLDKVVFDILLQKSLFLYTKFRSEKGYGDFFRQFHIDSLYSGHQISECWGRFFIVQRHREFYRWDYSKGWDGVFRSNGGGTVGRPGPRSRWLNLGLCCRRWLRSNQCRLSVCPNVTQIDDFLLPGEFFTGNNFFAKNIKVFPVRHTWS